MNESLQQALTILAQKIGTSAENLWGIYVKQAAIVGWVNLIEIVFFILFMAAFAVYVYKACKKKWYDSYDCSVGHMIVTVVGACLCVIFTVCAFCNFEDSISCFKNPEYKAFRMICKDIGEMAGKKTQ